MKTLGGIPSLLNTHGFELLVSPNSIRSITYFIRARRVSCFSVVFRFLISTKERRLLAILTISFVLETLVCCFNSPNGLRSQYLNFGLLYKPHSYRAERSDNKNTAVTKAAFSPQFNALHSFQRSYNAKERIK